MTSRIAATLTICGACYALAWLIFGSMAEPSPLEAQASAPPPPAGFSATATGTTTVRLNWQLRSGVEMYYITYRNASGSIWAEIARPGGTVSTYDVSGLACGTTYRFAIKGYGDGQTYAEAWGTYAYVNRATNPCLTPTPPPTATPTPTAAPTATPTPTPTLTPPATSCVTSLGILPDMTPTTRNGTWDAACDSTSRTSEFGPYFAHFYTFRVAATSDVRIDLISSTDPYLYLLSGAGKNGSELAEDDDGEGPPNSRIELELSAGTYTAEATTYDRRQLGSFELEIAVKELPESTDITTLWHWHSESPEYRLVTSQLPDSWESAIREAADAWSDRTDITINENTASGNTITRDSIPPTWHASCDPAITAACTTFSPAGDHIISATTIFNEDITMGTSSLNCALDFGTDVQTVALHEFGHFAGFLSHSTDSGTVMYLVVNNCQRTPTSSDINSMNAQYSGHP